MPRIFFFLAAACVLFSAADLYGQSRNTNPAAVQTRWYVSNASGMALRYVSSRLEALRNEYGLSVETISPDRIPPLLVQYFRGGFLVELRVLYENREEVRQQWIFRDQRGTARLNASGLSIDDILFIEMFNENYFLIEERQFASDHERQTRYTYSNGILIRAETWIIEEDQANAGTPDFTDYYRYTRSSSLRAIERIYHSGITEASRISFPGIASGRSEPEFMNPGQVHISPFIDDMRITEDTSVIYTTDSRGRVLTETWRDENGDLIGELRNTWSGDRLESVFWSSGEDENLTEYEYDSRGNRITERNYRDGILERIVRSEGSSDIEEIYMDGRIILRAVWEDGRKISEERIR